MSQKDGCLAYLHLNLTSTQFHFLSSSVSQRHYKRQKAEEGGEKDGTLSSASQFLNSESPFCVVSSIVC